MAQVEGHGLRGSGQCGVATGLGPRSELPPCGAVGPAGVLSLGVPESGGNGLGRTAVSIYNIIDPGIYGVIDPPWERGELSNIRFWSGGQSPPLPPRSFRWGDSFSR